MSQFKQSTIEQFEAFLRIRMAAMFPFGPTSGQQAAGDVLAAEPRALHFAAVQPVAAQSQARLRVPPTAGVAGGGCAGRIGVSVAPAVGGAAYCLR